MFNNDILGAIRQLEFGALLHMAAVQFTNVTE